MTLLEQISKEGPASPEVNRKFMERMLQGNPTRDENSASHFCVYFLLYNTKAKTIFITHHKKSGLWLVPGGHIDKGENTISALVRELSEELGIKYDPPGDLNPFLRTITYMDDPTYSCKTHFDTWYGIETDGSDFHIDPIEFLATKWTTIQEARGLIIDKPNLEALGKMERLFK